MGTSGILLSSVVLAACVCSINAIVFFSLTDCAKNRSRALLTFPTAHTHPYPIVLPGNLEVSASLRVNRDILPSSSIALDLTIQRYLGFFWFTIPCISNVGSCWYNDACTLFGTDRQNDDCAAQFADHNLPCSCPFLAGTYSMPSSVFEVPELTGAFSWLANGDYRVKARLVDTTSSEELACQFLTASLSDGRPPCSGFLCDIFG